MLGSSSLTARKILAPCKLPSLGSSWYQGQKKKQTWRRPGLHGIQLPKVDNFVWRCHRTILMILMTADNIQDKFCFKDTPRKRETQWKVTSNQSTTMSKTVRVEYIRIYPNTSELHVCCSHPPFCFHSPLPPRQISACKLNEKLFRLLGSS